MVAAQVQGRARPGVEDPMRLLVLLAIVIVAPAAAAAGASPPPPTDPPPLIHVEGAATVRDIRAEVRCTTSGIVEIKARCEVNASFEIEATGAVTFSALNTYYTVDFGGHPSGLEAGQRTRVTIAGPFRLATSTRFANAPFIIPVAWVRHPLLGRSRDLDQRDDNTRLIMISGRELIVEGEAALDVHGEGKVVADVTRGEVRTDRTGRPTRSQATPRSDDPDNVMERRVVLGLTLRGRGPGRGLVQQGGPVIGLGAREDRFLMRGGWEVAVATHFYVQAMVETDFDSIFESIVVEAASDSYLVLLPSFHVGTGLVAGQYLPRGPDVGVRLRAGVNFLTVLGVDMDFDYWPSVGEWTLVGAGRLSL